MLLHFFNNLGTFLEGLHIEGDQRVMALGKGLEEGLLHTLVAYDGSHLEQTTEHNHVEHLAVLHLGSLVHGVDLVDGDVLTGGLVDDTKAVVDENTTGLDLRLELFE